MGQHAPETETARGEVYEIPRDISTQGARQPRVSMTTAHSLETLQKLVSKINSSSPSSEPPIWSLRLKRDPQRGPSLRVSSSLRVIPVALCARVSGRARAGSQLIPFTRLHEWNRRDRCEHTTTPAHAYTAAVTSYRVIGSISTVGPKDHLSLSQSLSHSLSQVW